MTLTTAHLQVLSVYLHELLKRPPGGPRPRAIDLGAGTGASRRENLRDRSRADGRSLTGLLSLSLASQGFDVLATDVPSIANTLLASNLSRNSSLVDVGASAPILEARPLDWFAEPSTWTWDQPSVTPLDSISPSQDALSTILSPPFDLIVTTDSIYHPTLSQPLLRTLTALTKLCPPSTPVFVALEVRDPVLIAAFFDSARTEWGFKCAMVEEERLKMIVRRRLPEWEDEDWEGVQVWRLTRKKERRGQKEV